MSSVLKVKTKSTPQSIRIETNILEPQSISQQHATFLFKNTGVMDKNTRIVVPISCNNQHTQLYLGAGAFGLIETATLKYAGNTLAQTDNVGGYQAIRRLLKPQEHRQKVGATKTNAPFCWYPNQVWKTKTDATPSRAEVDTENVEDGRLAFKSDCWNRNQGVYKTGPQETLGMKPHPRYKLRDTEEGEEEGFTAVFSLDDLFPELMKDIQLPLFLLNEQLSLEILWTDPSLRGWVSQAGVLAGHEANIQIDTDNTFILQDLLFFDDNTTNKIRAENTSTGGIGITYGDLVNLRTTIINPTGTAPNPPVEGEMVRSQGDYTIDIGLDNMVVRYMVMSMADETDILHTDDNPAKANWSLGKYNSIAPMVEAGGLEYNLIVNNSPVYPENIKSMSRQYTQLQQVFSGTPLQVPKGCYSQEGSALDSYAVSQLINGSVIDPDPMPSVGDIWGGLGEVEGNCLLATSRYDQTGSISEAPFMSLVGSQRYLGVNLSTTYENVRGAGTRIGNSAVRLRIRNTYTSINTPLFVAQPLTNRVVNVWSCVERTMVIKNGDIYVSEN